MVKIRWKRLKRGKSGGKVERVQRVQVAEKAGRRTCHLVTESLGHLVLTQVSRKIGWKRLKGGNGGKVKEVEGVGFNHETHKKNTKSPLFSPKLGKFVKIRGRKRVERGGKRQKPVPNGSSTLFRPRKSS